MPHENTSQRPKRLTDDEGPSLGIFEYPWAYATQRGLLFCFVLIEATTPVYKNIVFKVNSDFSKTSFFFKREGKLVILTTGQVLNSTLQENLRFSG